MTAATICYGLVAAALCTVHLCLGFWIGSSWGFARRQDAQIDQATTMCPDHLEEIVHLTSFAQKLNGECSRDPRLPAKSATDIESLLEGSANLKTSMGNLHTAVQGLQPKKPRALRSVEAMDHLEASFSGSRAKGIWLPAAPMTGDKYPGAEQFERLLCRNFSKTGFSYFAEEPPPYRFLIMGLGTPPGLTFFLAEAIGVEVASLNGASGYRIDCRFVRKLLPIYRWDERLGKIVAASSLIFTGAETVASMGWTDGW